MIVFYPLVKSTQFLYVTWQKYEGTENDIEALSRELREELNVTISKMEFLVIMKIFLC